MKALDKFNIFSAFFGVYVYIFFVVYSIIFNKWITLFVSFLGLVISISICMKYYRKVLFDGRSEKRTLQDSIRQAKFQI